MSDARRSWRRPTWVKAIAAGMGRARTLGLAAEMSFWLFLALVPLAAVAGLVAARVAVSHASAASSLLSGVPPTVRELISRQVQRVAAWQGGTVAPAAAATFVWLASSGVHSVFDALEVQTGTSRPWWKKRLLAVGACIGLSVGVALLALLAAGIGWVETLAGKALPIASHVLGGPVGTGVRYAVAAILAVVLVAGLYRVGIPREACARVAVFPGALAAVALQVVLVWAYGLYVTKLGSGDAYQAGLAIVGVTLMTLWLSSLALLVGAQLNGVLGERRARRRTQSGPPVAERLRPPPAWPPSGESSSRPTSPTPPTGRPTGPSSSQRASGPR